MRWMLITLIIVSLGIHATAAYQAPRPINYGQTVEGDLNDVQQALQFIFDAQAGDNITILMQTTSGDLNAALSLSSFEGDLIAEDDDSGGGTDALIQMTIETSGSYVITATRSLSGGGSGSFSLTLSTGQSIAPETQDLVVGPRLQPILRGSSIQGALTDEVRFNLYWFEGRSGETVTVTPDSGTSLQPLLVLYDSRFIELLRSAPGTVLNVSLPGDDIYFIAAALPETASGGNYALTLSSGGDTDVVASPPRDVQPGQNPIAYGESVRGNISDTAAAYTLQFRGSAGDTITINMARAGGDLDSYLYLLDSGGITIAEDDNSGGNGADARISHTLPADGDYLILATRQGQAAGTTSGSFLLTLQSDSEPIVIPTNTAADGRPPNLASFPEIRIGDTVSGTISNQVYFNVYVFLARAEDELVITMESTSDLDPMLVLLDANQQPIAENDDIVQGENQDSEIRFTAPEEGYYVIVASRFDQDLGETEGSYDLTLRRAGEDAAAPAGDDSLIRRLDAVPIVPGGTPTGAFEPLRFADIYTFGTAEESNLVDFSVTTDNIIATTVIMTDDRLQPVAVTDGGTLLGVQLSSPGNYLFIVAPAAGPAEPISENYILAFNAQGENTLLEVDEDETPQERAAIPLNYGDSVTGEITDDAPSQDYTFSGVSGDIIRVSMTALPDSDLDTVVQLLDSDGNLVAEHDDIVAGENRNSLLQTTLPADGQYTIRATRFTSTDETSASEGEYELELEYVDPETVGISPTVLPIQSGETVNNSVNSEQYLMFYSFNANSGDLVTIEVNTLSGDLDAVLYLYAYTSAGEPIEIHRNDDSPRGGTFDPFIENLPLPRTGTYLIAVGRYPERESSGDFSMTLTITPPVGGEPDQSFETATPPVEG